MRKEALLVIDMQKGTLAPVIGKKTLVNNINSLIDCFHEKGLPVIFVKQAGYGDISAKLNRQATDVVAKKSKPNAFTSAEFTEAMTAAACDSVVVVGLMSNACVQQTCKGALSNNYKVTLISDAHDSVIKFLRNIYTDRLNKLGATTLVTKDYLADR